MRREARRVGLRPQNYKKMRLKNYIYSHERSEFNFNVNSKKKHE